MRLDGQPSERYWSGPGGVALLAWLLTSLGSSLVPTDDLYGTFPIGLAHKRELVIIGAGMILGFLYAIETTVRSRKSSAALYVLAIAAVGLGWVFYEFKPALNYSMDSSMNLACADIESGTTGTGRAPIQGSCAKANAARRAKHQNSPKSVWLDTWYLCALILPLISGAGLKIRKGWAAKKALHTTLAIYGLYLCIPFFSTLLRHRAL